MRIRSFAGNGLLLAIWVASILAPKIVVAADAKAETVTVLVAASAQDVLKEIGSAFEKETGIKIVISPGPSNGLANQIINGAPADLFLSASQEWADKVKTEGLADSVQPLLGNALVIVVPKGNPAKIAAPKDLLADAVKRLALAGEKVPAGKYAEQALEAAKLYQELTAQKKIVRGQDVRATLTFVESGEVEAGIVYATDAKISEKVETVFTFDPKTYEKIVYPIVLTKQGKQNSAAVKFQEFLLAEKAAGIFETHGFVRLK